MASTCIHVLMTLKSMFLTKSVPWAGDWYIQLLLFPTIVYCPLPHYKLNMSRSGLIILWPSIIYLILSHCISCSAATKWLSPTLLSKLKTCNPHWLLSLPPSVTNSCQYYLINFPRIHPFLSSPMATLQGQALDPLARVNAVLPTWSSCWLFQTIHSLYCA